MKLRHVAETVLALALTPACGADLSSDFNGSSSPTVMTSALQAGLVDEEEEWEDSMEEVQVGAETATEVRHMYGELKASGALGENEWRLNDEPPPEQQYAHVALEDDVDQGLSDGYETMAWVPVDDAGNVAEPKVYMVRVGGVAGWQFVAGPFNLAK